MKTLDPALVLRLAKLLPSADQPTAVAGIVRHLADTDPSAAAEMARSIDGSDSDKSYLLVQIARSVAIERSEGKPDLKKIQGQCAWLRKEAPSGHAEQAVGTFLAAVSQRDLSRAMEAYRQETVERPMPDPALTGAFVRTLGMTGPAHFKEAMPLAEAMPAGEEREHSLRALAQLPWAKQSPITNSKK